MSSMAEGASRGYLNSVHSQAHPFVLLMKGNLAGCTIGRPNTLHGSPGMHCGFCCATLLDQGLGQRVMRPSQCLIASY